LLTQKESEQRKRKKEMKTLKEKNQLMKDEKRNSKLTQTALICCSFVLKKVKFLGCFKAKSLLILALFLFISILVSS